MRRYIFRRLLELIPTTAGVLLLTFTLFHVIGGSPAEDVLGQHANAASLAAFDARYGYDKPLLLGNWALTRAWNDALRLPPDGLLLPSFPLPEGRWRLRLTRATPGTAEILLVSLDAAHSNRLTASFSPESMGRGTRCEFDVPAGWQAAEIALPPCPAAARAQLRRRTAHCADSQLVHYLAGLLSGDLADSTAYGMRVARVLREGLGPSLALTVPMLLGGFLLALMLAMTAAVWRDAAPDRAVLLGSTLLMSLNYVIWVLAGQYLLAYKLRLFPIWGFENWTYLLLPIIIGIVSGLGRDIRFYRTVLLDELHRPYVRTAIAKGLPARRVLWVHVLRNSLIPIVTYLSLSVPFLFTGSLLLESFFGIPGLGGVSLNAIHSSDMATVRAVVIVGALLYQLVNLATDLCYAWLDPRVRLS